MDYITTISGLLAFCLTTSSYAFKDDHTLRVVNFSACVFWALHMMCLGAWSSFAMVTLAIFMIGGALLDRDDWSLKLWLVNLLLIPVTVVSAMAGFVSGAALLPILGGFFINTGVVRFSGMTLTVFIAAGEVVWLINGFVIGSNFAILNNGIGLAVLIVRMWRLRRDRDLGRELAESI
jgi:hypothetical protein